MSARVVEVIEALLREGIVVSRHPSPSGSSPTEAGGRDEVGDTDASKANREEDPTTATPATGSAGAEAVSAAGHEGAESSESVAGRAERVAGVFHSSVAAENADRLDACYWARVSQSQQARREGGRGGGGVMLDEAFVLTPDLR